ncbi:MAG: Unknown protein [uncultured Sulfurovum sp.]|uniref:Uncharacterized protein n=1 Tax=uncultured Sulfurovum sp. TaxID=269237 RepID=A0A6S6TJK5_9BACT|nr:MAG: Unknown protein [uncultured Sulfurovum sp.]
MCQKNSGRIIMKKNLLLKIIFALILSFVSYITFINYFISDGFRNYKSYCSQFIIDLEYYREKHHKYPQNLLELAGGKTGFNFRYNPKDCGYQSSEEAYTFYYSEGLGVGGYDSKTKEWWRD